MPDDTQDLAAEARDAAPPVRAFGRLRLLTAADARAVKPPPYILPGLIARGALSVMWGPPKSGKSFLALRLAFGLARGVGMWGREPSRPHRALYLALEGSPDAIAGRVRAMAMELGDDAGRFAYVAQRATLGPPATDLDDAIEAARAHGAEVVVVDTLARGFGTGNESLAADMGRFIASVDQLREATGAHVLVIHHGSKDDTAGMRGSIALLGALDVELHVARAHGDVRTVTLADARDEAEGARLAFGLRQVTLGTRPDGSPWTTAVAEEAEATTTDATRDRARREARLSDASALLLRELRRIATDAEAVTVDPTMPPVRAVTRRALRAALVAGGWFRDDELRAERSPRSPQSVPALGERSEPVTREAQRREGKALEALKRKGFAGFNASHVWPA